jgi:hypothetical protein
VARCLLPVPVANGRAIWTFPNNLQNSNACCPKDREDIGEIYVARRLASMGKRWDTGDHGSINGPLQEDIGEIYVARRLASMSLPYISVRCHATGHLVASLTGSTNGQYTL